MSLALFTAGWQHETHDDVVGISDIPDGLVTAHSNAIEIMTISKDDTVPIGKQVEAAYLSTFPVGSNYANSAMLLMQGD